MQELRRQHPELMEAERAIFAGAEGGKVIALSSDDEVEGGEDGGTEGGEVIALSSDDEVEGCGDGGAEGVEVGPRMRSSTSTSGGVPSPTTPTTVLARTRLAAHRT